MRYNRIFLCFLTCLLFFGGCQRVNATKPPEKDFLEQTVFLGDSITAHMASRADVSPYNIWAAKARYLNLDSRITYAKIVAPDTGKEELIAEVAARIRPAYLVVTLGIDYGVYYYRNELETFAKYYEKLLDAIQTASPSTTILLQSIFPVSAACKNLTNEMIDNANEVIREIARRRDLPFLDTQNVLRDENGFLREEYCYSEDGIHLNESAYAAILSYIRNKSVEMGWQA